MHRRLGVAALAVAIGSIACGGSDRKACHEASGTCAAAAGSGADRKGELLRLSEAASSPPAWSTALHERACDKDAPAAPAREEGHFVDVTDFAGVAGPLDDPCSDELSQCMALAMTGGAAAGDFDADGLPDLYVTRLHWSDSLYLNCGGGRFADVAETVGLTKLDEPSNGAAWADVDADGDLDLMVTTFGKEAKRHYLYIQEGGSFHEDGIDRGVAMLNEGPLYGTSIAFGDYDGDGYLDLFVGEWRRDAFVPEGAPSRNHARLFHNRGADAPGFYEDVTERAGVTVGGMTSNGVIDLSGAFVFTPVFADLDDDGAQDLVLTADFGSSRLFWNQKDGTFLDGTKDAKVGSDQAGMGASIADYDGDGRLDWFVTSIFEPLRRYNGNRLYRNEGKRKFRDATDETGVRDVGWGWGNGILDYDNDGDLDLLAVAGYTDNDLFLKEYKGRFSLWQNPAERASGEDDAWHNVAPKLAPAATAQGRGVAVLDFDADGDQDVFVVYHDASDALLRNDTSDARQHFLRVLLRGKTNRFGIGARVSIDAKRGKQMRELHAGSGYLSESESVAHFGLGTSDEPVDVTVTLSAGVAQTFRDVAVDRTIAIEEQ